MPGTQSSLSRYFFHVLGVVNQALVQPSIAIQGFPTSDACDGGDRTHPCVLHDVGPNLDDMQLRLFFPIPSKKLSSHPALLVKEEDGVGCIHVKRVPIIIPQLRSHMGDKGNPEKRMTRPGLEHGLSATCCDAIIMASKRYMREDGEEAKKNVARAQVFVLYSVESL